MVLSALIVALMSEAKASCLTIHATNFLVGLKSSVATAVFAATAFAVAGFTAAVFVADLAVMVAAVL